MEPTNFSSIEDVDKNRWFKRHPFAKCREFFLSILGFDFYQDYYMSIKKLIKYDSSKDPAMEKLDEYVEKCDKAGKYRILRTLTICLSESVCGVKASVFNEFHSTAWGKELLTYVLMSNNSTWDIKHVPELVREVNTLDTFIKENVARYCVEDILEILIKVQNACQLDIGFIIKVVKLLCFSVQSLDVISREFSFLPSIIDELETLRLRKLCDQQRILYTEEKQLVELHNLLLYSDETVDSTLSKVKQNTEITELIDFFQTLKDNELIDKENFLRQLIPHRNIDIWKNELYFPLIQSFIRREFPAYHGWLPRLDTFESRRIADAKYFSDSENPDKKSCTKYCETDEMRQKELKRSLNDSEKGLALAQMLHDLNHKLAKLLLKCGWSDKTAKIVKKWIECLDTESKVAELIGALDVLQEYDMDITESELSKLISEATLANVQKEVHKFVINHVFSATNEKTLDQLIEELVKLNANKNVHLLENKDALRDKYDKVMAAYHAQSSVTESEKKIKDWGESEIQKWAEAFKNKSFVDISKPEGIKSPRNADVGIQSYLQSITSTSQYEIVAVIKRAMELVSGLHIRDIQLLSVILLVNNEDNTGRLAQINTGEGKTTIVAMLAAYHAVRGSRVDVITSSQLLAIPQVEQQSKFYETLKITVAHNFYRSSAYKCDVVYGTSQEFQGDILRDEFRKNGNRHGRKCDIAIVDEVDNMLVDGNNYIVMLSSQMPAMDHLEPILAAIYMQVNAAAASIVEKNGQTYFVEQDNALDEKGQLKKDVEVNCEPIKQSKREFIENSTERHIRHLIRDCDASSLDKDFPEIKIPHHLREFICKTQLKQWIRNALAAVFNYTKGEDYILVGEEVKIVDAENTGVVQPNMTWSDGLHQFIQIQHGAKITPESLTTNFISNVSFFQRYRPKVYGLSGTLGSKATTRLLNKTYEVDTVIIPPFKTKRHKELATIIVSKRDDWYKSIARSCLRKLKNGRAVLVIMEYIRETEILEIALKGEFNYDKKKIKMYKTNEDSSVVDKALNSGDIIITTNIAGRGTDVKLSKDVNVNGGLHVCVTFLPRNSRVEQQNIGRTARTGNRGTSQFILLNSETDIRELRIKREEKEENAMRSAEKVIARVTAKDAIFHKFCKLTDAIKGRNEFVREIENEAVEERFAIWMRMNNDKFSEGLSEEVLKDFESFEEDIMRDERSCKLIRNPYLYVKIGNNYLDKEKYDDAIREYTSAINLDENFAEHAYYNRGYAYIARYGNNVSGNSYYIDKAVEDLKKARALITEREHGLHFEQHASRGEVFGVKLRNKLNLYNLQKNAIDAAIGPDVVSIEAQLKQLEKDQKSDKLTSEQKKEIETSIKNLKELKENKGVIQKARSYKSERDVKIERQELVKCLPTGEKSYDNEIKEFERNGAIGGFQISEIPPIDWSAVIGLLALGFGQLILGAALTVFTLGGGASFGMGLISEGISDIITAVKDGIINRSFSWATWAIEKAISLTISVVCAGFKAMKDVAKTAYAGAKTAASIGTKVVTQTVKEGWKIVAKKVGYELAKGVGKSIATDLINYGVNKTLIPLIQQAIMEKVQGPIEQALLGNAHVKTMLLLDEKNDNRHYENRIKAMGNEILNPAKNTDLASVALRIATGIADQKIPGFSAVRIAGTAVAGAVELTTFTDNFIAKLNKSISKEAEKEKIDEHLSGKAGSNLQQNNSQATSDTQNVPRAPSEDIDLDRARNKDSEQVKRAKMQNRDPSGISNDFSRDVAISMVSIIQGKMIAPVVQAGVNYTSEALTSNIEKAMSNTVENYRAEKRLIYHQNNGFSRKEKKKEKEKEKVKKYKTEEQFAVDKIDEVIDDARNGGPSGLMHLGAASDAVNRPIEVHDEKGRLLYIIGEDKTGKPVKVEYHKPKNGGTVGHYTMPGGREPFNNAGGSNLCLYNVIGEQTGYDSKDVKNVTLKIMQKNKHQMAKQASDITRLQMYAEMKLAMGGARYDGKCPDDMGDYIKNSNGKRAFGFDNVGHNDLHFPYKDNRLKLEAMAEETNRQIEIYENGVLVPPPIGKKSKEPPIKLEYHRTEGDKSTEHYTEVGGTEKYSLHNPLDKTLYDITAKQTQQDPTQLASNVRDRMTKMEVPKETSCLENAMKMSNKKSGYTSQYYMNFVMHYAMQTDKAKKAMDKLNSYKKGSKATKDQKRQVVTLSKEELGLPKNAYATAMIEKDGKLVQCVYPVESITFLLQHHDNQQANPNAPVHIHTTYPIPPGNLGSVVEGNPWGPFDNKNWTNEPQNVEASFPRMPKESDSPSEQK